MTIQEIREKYPQETTKFTDTEIDQYKTVAEIMADVFLKLVDKEVLYD